MNYLKLMRLDRPIGIFLLLWPTLAALCLAADTFPPLNMIIVFSLGVFFLRAGGSVINDICDHKIDKNVARTCQRPLAAGRLSIKEALYTFVILMFFALGLLYFLNSYTRMMAVAGLLLTLMYPLSKRIFYCPQLVLGIVWSWGILMAFTQLQHQITLIALLFYASHLCLTMAYDSIYALADKPDDIQVGVYSSVIWFGSYDKYMIIFLQGMTILLLILLGFIAKLHAIYYVLLSGVMLCFYYQHQLMHRKQYIQAFGNNQWVGLLLLIGIICSRYYG